MIGDQGSAPDLLEPVICFRWFSLVTEAQPRTAWGHVITMPPAPHPVNIASVWQGHYWTGKEQRAVCLKAGTRCADAPAHDCMCGFYGYYEPTPIASTRWISPSTNYVPGIVMLYGRVEVHSKGARASHARLCVLGLPADKDMRKLLKKAAKIIGVRVADPDALELLAWDYGSPMPDQLKPIVPEEVP